METQLDIVQLLTYAVERGASDLHVCAGSAAMMRLHGDLIPLTEGSFDAEACREMIFSIFTENQRARFEENWELDFAVMVKGLGRFRANAHYSRGSVEAAFRYIPDQVPSLDVLGLPPIVKDLCHLEQGLVLVTGITGSGKTTTLAAMVEEINNSRAGLIISIEDPIEYIFTHKLCRIKQREIGTDTKSFPIALRHVLRQDPDVILISEMRDLETISSAITAAETGHLVLATLHTIDAPKAIDRIVDAFPADQQGQIIAQLANALQGIIAQRLLPRADGSSSSHTSPGESKVSVSSSMEGKPAARIVTSWTRVEGGSADRLGRSGSGLSGFFPCWGSAEEVVRGSEDERSGWLRSRRSRRRAFRPSVVGQVLAS